MATRIYLPLTGAAPITPAFGTWTETTGAARIAGVATRLGSAMTSKTQAHTATAANSTFLSRQYVFGPLAAHAAGTPTDPTSVRLRWRVAGGVETTWAFGTDVQVVKDGVGLYHAECEGHSRGGVDDVAALTQDVESGSRGILIDMLPQVLCRDIALIAIEAPRESKQRARILLARTLSRDRGLLGPRMSRQWEVLPDQAHLVLVSRIHQRLDLAVSARAVGTLKVRELDDRDRRAGRSERPAVGKMQLAYIGALPRIRRIEGDVLAGDDSFIGRSARREVLEFGLLPLPGADRDVAL